MFGDGQLAACKPISERDLASYMALCIEDAQLHNKVLPIGGPGKALTALEQGTMLFKLMDKDPNFIKVPIEIMTGVIKVGQPTWRTEDTMHARCVTLLIRHAPHVPCLRAREDTGKFGFRQVSPTLHCLFVHVLVVSLHVLKFHA